jgi:hypothetical protein
MNASTLAQLAALFDGRLAGFAEVVRATGDVVLPAVSDPTPLLGVESEQPAPNLINTDGIVNFIATKVTPILLAVLGVIFISRAGKGEMSKVLTSSAIAIVGLAFIVGAGALFFFGEGLVNLIFGGN